MPTPAGAGPDHRSSLRDIRDTSLRTAGQAGGLRDVPGSRFNEVCPAEARSYIPSTRVYSLRRTGGDSEFKSEHQDCPSLVLTPGQAPDTFYTTWACRSEPLNVSSSEGAGGIIAGLPHICSPSAMASFLTKGSHVSVCREQLVNPTRRDDPAHDPVDDVPGLLARPARRGCAVSRNRPRLLTAVSLVDQGWECVGCPRSLAGP